MKPGYPKLIRDVWGIEGPIDAAFTRINCQGKTYLFQVPGPGAVGQGQGYPGRSYGCYAQDQGWQEILIPACGPCMGLCEERGAQGSRSWVTSLELRLLPWVGDSDSLPPPHPLSLSLPLRVVSTGASRMVSWTLITPATSPKASRAFLTMWTQPWPSLLIATVDESWSTSSRVLRGGGESEQAVE